MKNNIKTGAAEMIWSNFETDFKVMFDSCLREKGIEHALGLLHKFSQKVPILSQN